MFLSKERRQKVGRYEFITMKALNLYVHTLPGLFIHIYKKYTKKRAYRNHTKKVGILNDAINPQVRPKVMVYKAHLPI